MKCEGMFHVIFLLTVWPCIGSEMVTGDLVNRDPLCTKNNCCKWLLGTWLTGILYVLRTTVVNVVDCIKCSVGSTNFKKSWSWEFF